MGFEATFFPYFKQYCADRFGASAGERIFDEAERRLSGMIAEADYRENKYIKWHMDTNLLPSIAIYLTFKEFGDTADKAYEYTDDVLQIARLKKHAKNERMGRLPFGYFAFKLFCKRITEREYPEQGWDIEWIKYGRDEVQFNMKSCIYLDTTKRYNCVEMCPLFCKNDDVILAGYKPAVVFERSGTLALGQDACDFHFKNGKQYK